MPQLRHRLGELIRSRYEVRKELGAGGFGVVYGCRDSELGIVVAVKELAVLDGQEREDALQKFRAEAIHLSKLRHRHIVSGHYEKNEGSWRVCPFCGLDFSGQTHCPDHGGQLIAVQSRHYLVMEYIAGPDLLALLEDFGGQMPLEKLEKYARQLADALAFIHGKGLVHRDIKPENVRLRRAEDEVVLLDFGIATQGEEAGEKYGTRLSRQTSGGGTVGYAPENPEERRNPDARSDVHAFGMTLYHLATNLDPTNPADLRKIRAHGPRDFRPQISEKLEDLILACVAFEPRERPQNGGEILALLEAQDAPRPAPPAVAPRRNSASNQASTPQNSQSQTQSQQVQSQSQTPAPRARALLFRSGHAVSGVRELAFMIDEAPREIERFLFSGEIERWLNDLGEGDLAREAAQIRARDARRRAQGVENFAQRLGLPRPEIEVAPREVDFGTLSPGGKSSREMRLQNVGRGLLFGLVRASHPAVSTYGEWEGNRARLPLQFDAARLSPGDYGGEIELQSSAGRFAIPFRARVGGPSAIPAFWSVTFCGVFGMIAGALLRMSPVLGPTLTALDGLVEPQTAREIGRNLGFGSVLWLILGVWASLEAVARRSCLWPILFLFFGTGFCAYAAFVSGGWLAAGDSLFRPVFSGWGARQELWWMLAGAGTGAIYGAIRRLKNFSGARSWGVLGGFVAVAALAFLAILSARGGI